MTVIRDRALGERSKLVFIYPGKNKSSFQKVVLPFLENISIDEGKKANFASYNLLARNNNIFSYLSSNSRTFDVRFYLTLDHLKNSDIPGRLFTTNSLTRSENSEIEKQKFKITNDLTETIPYRGGPIAQSSLAVRFFRELNPDYFSPQRTNFFEDFISNTVLPFLKGGTNTQNTNSQGITEDEANRVFFDNSDNFKILDLMVFWINIIRTCNSNNQKNTLQGPPIIRLYHGILYNNIPCICQDWTIKPLDEHGFDLQTLLPRRIEIRMDLIEIREGDFGDFSPASYIKGDNSAGWEAVFEHGTTDPYDSYIWKELSEPEVSD